MTIMQDVHSPCQFANIMTTRIMMIVMIMIMIIQVEIFSFIIQDFNLQVYASPCPMSICYDNGNSDNDDYHNTENNFRL